MNYSLLFILIEGDDDERFFQRIIKPKLEEKYNTVKLWKYAEKRNEKIDNFLKSIMSMKADYIFIGDINKEPCITSKKQKIQKNKIKNIDNDRITVIIKEIESWYLAGLSIINSKKLGIPFFDTTDSIDKEKFNDLIPKKFDSRIDFMLEILKYFSIEMAKQKNKSFSYFFEKHDCEV